MSHVVALRLALEELLFYIVAVPVVMLMLP